MMGEKNGHNPEESQDLSQVPSAAPRENIQEMIGPAIHDTVNQYQGLLRQGLEQEVMRIIQEFDAATNDIESTIAQRVRSRLGELVQEEVRRVFDRALSNVEGSFGDPFLELKAGSSSPQRPQPQPNSQIPSNSSPNAPDNRDLNDNRNDWQGGDGGSKVEAAPTPGPAQSPPSLWVMPNIEEPQKEEPLRVEAVSQPVEPQMTQDPNVFRNWDDDEVELVENDEPEASTTNEDEVFEGTVRLNVEANGHIREVVHFVRELRQSPQLRLLRMVGNNKEGVEIWLGLREPLRLKQMLPEITGVAIETIPLMGNASDKERRLMVRLVPGKSTGESQEYPWLEEDGAKSKEVPSADQVIA